MSGVNKVILIGNLGIDPEVRTLESGTKLARLSIATSETYTNKDGARIEETEWHSVTLWRGLAEVAEKYLKKGNKVYIEGRLRTRSYTDKEGIQKYTTEIIADNMQMLGGSGEGRGRSGDSGGSSQNTSPNPQSQPAAQSQRATQSQSTVSQSEATTENADNDTDDLPF